MKKTTELTKVRNKSLDGVNYQIYRINGHRRLEIVPEWEQNVGMDTVRKIAKREFPNIRWQHLSIYSPWNTKNIFVTCTLNEIK